MQKDYLSHDQVYQKKDDWSGENYDFDRDWKWFLESTNLSKDISLLELGCGATPYLQNFSKISNKYLGIDISPSAINTAKMRNQNNKNNEFLCLNFIEDWENDRKFDLIVDSFFLHCIIGNDRKTAIQKIADSLNVDGEFWVNTMCNPPKLDDMLKTYNPDTKCLELERKTDKISIRQLDSPEIIREMIESCGLELVKERIDIDESQDNYFGIFRK